MKVFSIILTHNIIRLITAAICLMTFCGIGRCEETKNSECDEEIERLLTLHDLCKDGYMHPDSAMFYTVAALQKADQCYGFDSEKYVSIFTDYMIQDSRGNRKFICESIYPLVTQIFNPFTEWVWYPYYKLGLVMESLDELDKAKELYERTINAKITRDVKLESLIRLTNIKQKNEGGNLEDFLLPLAEEVNTLESPDKEDLLFLIARLIAEYYYSIGNDEKAIEYIDYGLRFEGYVSYKKIIKILGLKYDLLVKRDHIAAIECLNKSIKLASNEESSERYNTWLAAALVESGDYALNHLLNIEDAIHYYSLAIDLDKSPMAIYDPIKRVITRRIIYLLKIYGQFDFAIELGENLVKSACKDGMLETDLFYVNELADIYISAGKYDKATDLLSKYKNELFSYPSTKDKAILYEGKLMLSKGNYKDAISILEELINHETRKDVGLWAERYLASAYYNIGDKKMDAMSDNINQTTKRIISEQLWFISPRQRKNWLKFCEEALTCQLSMPNSDNAIKNAAELNLFKKSLLFRTNSQIEKILEEDPKASSSIHELKKLRKQLQSSITIGDSIAFKKLQKQTDECEQDIVNRFINADILSNKIDVKISDVTSKLNGNSVAIDFITLSQEGKSQTGAFIYSNNMKPCYVPLIEGVDSIPTDAYVIIWNKLYPIIKDFNNIYFCTDGFLNDVALEYAMFNDGQRINDIFRMHRVFHLSDIRKSDGIGKRIAFVGVADHNSPVKDESEINRGNWTDLNNVGLEFEMIKNRIDSVLLMTIVDNEATETKFKSLDNSDISTLHISTHGVFRNSSALNASFKNPQSDDYHIAKRFLAVEKTSISALILRRGNINWHSPELPDGDDDLLTAEEIEMMSFPDLRLTVLSACDSGLGEVDSEGVWGLQRAFRIAGTKSLICSLTKVDDYWTAQFMDAFYEHAAKGNTIYDSFHIAQKWLYNELPDNPEIWSSFILIE